MQRILALMLAALVAGCVAPVAGDRQAPLQESLERPRVVVGIVDSGINPYHEVFQDPGVVIPPAFVDARTGARPIPVALSAAGTFDERVAADRAVWAGLAPDTLYWFRGTRVLGLSLLETPVEHRFINNTIHGTGVASVLRNLSHEAWIVVVQMRFDLPAEDGSRPFAAFLEAAAGVTWLAEQPWVDIVSLSIGAEGNPPLPELEAIAAATHRAAQSGKVVAVGAANLPSPTLQSGTNGPPWVISVAGAEGSTQGVQPKSGQVVDVVSDYTRTVAGREPDEYFTLHGTSFGTPVVAGALAESLLQIRRAAGDADGLAGGVLCRCPGRDVASGDLRAALNATASYFSTGDWDPLNYSRDPVQLAAFMTAPVLPAPWVQMGWGYVGAETIAGIVAVLRGEAPPGKPAEAVEHMRRVQEAREAYWAGS